MDIRQATIDDAETISELNADVQKVHADALPHLFKPPSKDGLPAAEVASLIQTPNHFFYLALEDDCPVGYLWAEVRRMPETPFRYAWDYVYVNHISLRPEARSKGYGKQLLEAAANLARQQGIATLALDVWSFNTRAHAAFESFGFQNFNERMWMQVTGE